MSARRLVTPLITGARRWMSSNPGSSSSSGAASMNSFPSSVAPASKPETYDTKDHIDKMVKEEIRIAEERGILPDGNQKGLKEGWNLCD